MEGTDVYLYKQTHDHNFAPHGAGNKLTLACCKPRIRRAARPGDWVVSLAGKTNRFGAEPGAVVSAFRVEVTPSFAAYWDLEWAEGRWDRMYKPRGPHYEPVGRGKEHHGTRALQQRDLSVDRVLVAREYRYFHRGQGGGPEAGLWRWLDKVRDYRCVAYDDVKDALDAIQQRSNVPAPVTREYVGCCAPGRAKNGCGC